MKKFAISGIVVMLLSISLLAGAADHSKSGLYVFPVHPGTDEWAKLSTFDDQMAATQIPVEILGNMSTAHLVATMVENWWGYGLFTAYDNKATAMDILIEHSNGIKELAERPDGIQALMSYYDRIDMQSMHVKTATNIERKINPLQIMFVETLLSQGHMLKQLNANEGTELLRLLVGKNADKAGNEPLSLQTAHEAYERISLFFAYDCNSLSFQKAIDEELISRASSNMVTRAWITRVFKPYDIVTPNGVMDR